MTATSLHSNTGQARQLRLVGLTLLPVIALLAAAYFLFVRTDYAVLVTDARPAEAGAIVAELKKQEVPYRLEASGRTILVPAARADELRLAILDGSVSEPGSVGFELFNESDMGLTDFAQKINYQRALQGELARTIMEMDGIAHARVHLALPERSLFRASRSEPRAAVTVIPKPGTLIDADRVAGIRRLVASTVSDLKIENVAVLNQRGQLLSAEPEYGPADRMASATRLERGYAERIAAALAAIAPDLKLDIKVTTSPAIPDSEDGAEPELVPADQRNYAVQVELYSARPVPAVRQAQFEQAIARSAGVTSAAGDQILFLIEPKAPAPVLSAAEPAAVQGQADAPGDKIDTSLIEFGALGAALVGALLIYFSVRRRRLIRRDQLYIRLRDQLLLEGGS